MIFDELWRKECKCNKLQRSYDKDIKLAIKEKNYKRAEELKEEAAHFVSGHYDEIDALRSRKLVKQAIKLQIPRPNFQDETSWTHWYYGYVLTDKAYNELRSLIMKFQSERLEHRMRWVKIVLIPVGTFIIGVLATYYTMKRNYDQQSQAQTVTHQGDKADQPKQR
jgi:hypothetical protein